MEKYEKHVPFFGREYPNINKRGGGLRLLGTKV